MTRAWPPSDQASSSTRAWPPEPAAGDSTFQAQSFGLVSASTEFDGNNIAVATDIHNGYRVTLTGTAAARNLPSAAGAASGACWVWPGIPAMNGELLDSIEPNQCGLKLRVYSLRIPTTAPSQIRFGFGFMDTSSPHTATTGFMIGLDYDSTTLAQVIILRVSATGTWTPTETGTGQATAFGADWSHLAFSPSAIDELNAIPLGEDYRLSTIGSNTERFSTTYNPNPFNNWAYRFMFVGWAAGTGNNGDSIDIDADIWAHDLPVRTALTEAA